MAATALGGSRAGARYPRGGGYGAVVSGCAVRPREWPCRGVLGAEGSGEGAVEAQGGEAALDLGRCVGLRRPGQRCQLLGGEGEGVEPLGVAAEHVAHGRQRRRGQRDAQAPAFGAGSAAEQA